MTLILINLCWSLEPFIWRSVAASDNGLPGSELDHAHVALIRWSVFITGYNHVLRRNCKRRTRLRCYNSEVQCEAEQWWLTGEPMRGRARILAWLYSKECAMLLCYIVHWKLKNGASFITYFMYYRFGVLFQT